MTAIAWIWFVFAALFALMAMWAHSEWGNALRRCRRYRSILGPLPEVNPWQDDEHAPYDARRWAEGWNAGTLTPSTERVENNSARVMSRAGRSFMLS